MYWAVTAVLYLLCVLLLWFEVWLGAVQVMQATLLSIGTMGGSLLFYGLIRCHALLRLTPSQLAFGQGMQAIVCIIAAYAIATPVRGAILTLLLIVLLFCAFALTPRRSHQMSLFAIVALGFTMLWLTYSDPQQYSAPIESVHFILASSMLSAVVFLTGQFNRLRERLKIQKTELVNALARIQEIATHDELTLLTNRRHMKEVLAYEEKRHQLESKPLCLVLLDIDHFKSINDTYGHAAGDEALHDFAQQVQRSLRSNDVLARWGGEEFLLLLPNTEQDAAIVVIERVQKSMTELRLQSANGTLRLTFSAGLAVLSPGETVIEAIKRADKALFQAKAAGRNTQRLFDPQMEAILQARDDLKIALQKSISAGQMLLHYQPQVSADGRVTGAEALVRWQHPQHGLIFPGEFIGLAEESELIVALGQWVLTTACEQLAEWARHVPTMHLQLSVNVSARQLRHPDFVQHALSLLGATGINPNKLKLELTESMLVEDMEGTIAKMNVLKAVGVSFSLDDFGTGYSSLAYLKRLPLDQVKIDKSFVSDMLADANDAVITRTIIDLARGLGFSVIAEGVETAAQRDFLMLHGCHDFQGYFFSRPVPLNQFEAYLHATQETAG